MVWAGERAAGGGHPGVGLTCFQALELRKRARQVGRRWGMTAQWG